MPSSARWNPAARAWQATVASSHAGGRGELLDVCCAVCRATVNAGTSLRDSPHLTRPAYPALALLTAAVPGVPPGCRPACPFARVVARLRAETIRCPAAVWQRRNAGDGWMQCMDLPFPIVFATAARRRLEAAPASSHFLLPQQRFGSHSEPVCSLALAGCRLHSRQARKPSTGMCTVSRPKGAPRQAWECPLLCWSGDNAATAIFC